MDPRSQYLPRALHPGTTRVFPKNRGPQNPPQYIMILIIRIPKEGPLIFGTPDMALIGCLEDLGDSVRFLWLLRTRLRAMPSGLGLQGRRFGLLIRIPYYAIPCSIIPYYFALLNIILHYSISLYIIVYYTVCYSILYGIL